MSEVRRSSRPLVTVAVPFFNCARTLDQTIRSVFAQTRTDWELLLVDDGSTDGSTEIARSVIDDRVRVVSDGTNRGLVYRLNQIAELAATPYLCRMDGDDIMYPRRLEVQLAYLETHPEVDIVGAPIVSIDERCEIHGVRGAPTDDVGGPAALLRRAPFAHPTALGRTSWFRANRYDPEFLRAEDHELWCRTAGRARFAVVHEPLLLYREPTRINLRNYYLSCRTVRLIFRRYGPARVGRASTAALVAASFGKEFLYRAAAAAGVTGRLVSLRSQRPAPEIVAAARRALEAVSGASVPRARAALEGDAAGAT